jgi:hypothetical protein
MLVISKNEVIVNKRSVNRAIFERNTLLSSSFGFVGEIGMLGD